MNLATKDHHQLSVDLTSKNFHSYFIQPTGQLQDYDYSNDRKQCVCKVLKTTKLKFLPFLPEQFRTKDFQSFQVLHSVKWFSKGTNKDARRNQPIH